MTDVLASIGLVEIERYEKDTLVRFKEIFDKYSSALRNTNGQKSLYMRRINGFPLTIYICFVLKVLTRKVAI